MNNKNCAEIYGKPAQFKIDLCFKMQKMLFNSPKRFGIKNTFRSLLRAKYANGESNDEKG